MSSPASPRSSANPTRQQLDDLDALLQRMLELPVNQLEEPGEAPPAKSAPVVEPAAVPQPVLEAAPKPEAPDVRHWRLDVPQTPRDLQPHTGDLAFPSLETTAPAVPPPSVQPPKATPVSAVSIPLAMPVDPEPLPTSVPLVAPPPPKPRPAPPVSAPAIEPTPVDSDLPWGMRWLVQLNVWFDEAVAHLGSPGLWVRGQTGRTVLGWTGVTLLGIVALLLVLDWFGWTR